MNQNIKNKIETIVDIDETSILEYEQPKKFEKKPVTIQEKKLSIIKWLSLTFVVLAFLAIFFALNNFDSVDECLKILDILFENLMPIILLIFGALLGRYSKE